MQRPSPPLPPSIFLHTLEKLVRVPTGAISFVLIGLDAVVALVTCEEGIVTLPMRRSEILITENPNLSLLAAGADPAPEIQWEMAQMAKLTLAV